MTPLQKLILTLLCVFGLAAAGIYVLTTRGEADPDPQALITDALTAFAGLLSGTDEQADLAARWLDEHWKPGFAVMLVECQRWRLVPARAKLMSDLLRRKTGKDFPFDPRGQQAWHEYLWSLPYEPDDDYLPFKAALYSRFDEKFARYFAEPLKTTIRMDEVVWGGVPQDGIPPLIRPDTVPASKATYLDPDNVVFGVFINGHARAYPKRILAAHEMVKDTVAGESINGVFCTLCNTMIVYRTHIGEKHYELGTSGFLYRSNKLMYDRDTQSLWSTIRGEPVVGPLVGEGLRLEPLPVVTTTWADWRARHPATDVLSLETGIRRDYSEGAAYAAYYVTDELMFAVPSPDSRLKNKADVVAMRFAPDDDPLAISSEFLVKNPVYHDRLGTQDFVVLTDATGGSRVYEAKPDQFESWDQQARLTARDGVVWTVSEVCLESPSGTRLNRLPSHVAFWFGWHAAWPRTRLVR